LVFKISLIALTLKRTLLEKAFHHLNLTSLALSKLIYTGDWLLKRINFITELKDGGGMLTSALPSIQ
jgi:hypothetical protein